MKVENNVVVVEEVVVELIAVVVVVVMEVMVMLKVVEVVVVVELVVVVEVLEVVVVSISSSIDFALTASSSLVCRSFR